MGRGTVCNDRVWGCGGQSAAAHMGAALREITGGRRIGRGRTPPLRMDRGCGMYWRRGEGTPPYGGGTRSAVGAGRRGRRPLRVHNKWCVGCRRRGEGTPPYGGGTRSAVGAGRRGRRPLRVHNKWCVGCRRQGEGTPPYGGISRGAVKRVVEDADPYESIAGSAVRGEYGLPHQRARWFAMTYYFGAARGRRGRRDGKFF